jgi:hypothetical protein
MSMRAAARKFGVRRRRRESRSMWRRKRRRRRESRSMWRRKRRRREQKHVEEEEEEEKAEACGGERGGGESRSMWRRKRRRRKQKHVEEKEEEEKAEFVRIQDPREEKKGIYILFCMLSACYLRWTTCVNCLG